MTAIYENPLTKNQLEGFKQWMQKENQQFEEQHQELIKELSYLIYQKEQLKEEIKNTEEQLQYSLSLKSKISEQLYKSYLMAIEKSAQNINEDVQSIQELQSLIETNINKTNLQMKMEEVRSLNKERLVMLEEERNKIREENKEREAHLKRITEELLLFHSTDMLENALQRLESICSMILGTADENTKLHIDSAETRIKNFQRQVRELDIQIEKAKETLQNEIQYVQTDNYNHNVLQKPRENANEEKIVYRNEKAAPLYEQEIASIHSQEGSSNEGDTVSNLPNEEIKRKIADTRYKYIIGKLAGDQLLNDQGEVIIEKYEEITITHIEAVQREGKLPELIMNMVIPGMELTK